MNDSEDSGFPFAKTVVIAVGLLVGVGLCGIDYLLAANGIGKSTAEFGVGILDAPSLIIMVLSAAGLGLTFIAWMITAVVSSFGPTDSTDNPHRPLNLSEKVSQIENHPRHPDDKNIHKQD